RRNSSKHVYTSTSKQAGFSFQISIVWVGSKMRSEAQRLARSADILVGGSRASCPLAKCVTLFVQLTDTACVTRRWYAEQCVATRCQPVIEDWPKFGERPHRHKRGEPFPKRQDFDDLDPREVAFGPTTVRRARVHLFSHLFPRVWCGAFQNFWIVVIQPFNAMGSIERLNMRAHPATEVAVAVGVNFSFLDGLIHCFRGIIRQFAFDMAARINYIAIR